MSVIKRAMVLSVALVLLGCGSEAAAPILDENHDCISPECPNNFNIGEPDVGERDVGEPDVIVPPSPEARSMSTFCGAAGISSGGGHRLTHCLAPYDGAPTVLAGQGLRLESGAFRFFGE
ncbi:MAG: hypothetical protein ACNA8W_07630 [Bradymonadaceae bacterium]